MHLLDILSQPGARLTTVSLATLLLITACGGGTAGNPGQGTSGASQQTKTQPVAKANQEEWSKLKGDIIADGSSTVYPITAAAAEEFQLYANDVRITVGISGTGGGFKKFCSGETGISDASRPIKPSEMEECAKNGIEFVELPVAYDGIAVIANPKNTWADKLTVEELKTIWQPEAQGKIDNWNQVRPDFPDKKLTLCGPGTDSGTFDYFTEAINGQEKASRGDFQASEDDNVIVTCVAGDEAALGYFGYAYYQENKDRLKLIPVEHNGKTVAPSEETIANASYQPLSRPIFIYVRKDRAAESPVKEFVNFYLSDSFTPLISSREVGYVPLPSNVYQAVQKRFNTVTTGTMFPQGAEVGATLDRYLK